MGLSARFKIMTHDSDKCLLFFSMAEPITDSALIHLTKALCSKPPKSAAVGFPGKPLWSTESLQHKQQFLCYKQKEKLVVCHVD